MRSLVGGGRSQKTTSGGCVSAIQMCQEGVNKVRWGGGFLVCHKAAGVIVRSVVTEEIKHQSYACTQKPPPRDTSRPSLCASLEWGSWDPSTEESLRLKGTELNTRKLEGKGEFGRMTLAPTPPTC